MFATCCGQIYSLKIKYVKFELLRHLSNSSRKKKNVKPTDTVPAELVFYT